MEEHSTVPLLAALRIELGALCPYGQSAVMSQPCMEFRLSVTGTPRDGARSER